MATLGFDRVDFLEPCKVLECHQSMEETFRVPLLLFDLQDFSNKDIADIVD